MTSPVFLDLSRNRGGSPTVQEFREMTENEPGWLAVAPLERIPADRGLCVIVENAPIALFRWNDEVFAIDDRCPHMGVSLASGRMEGGVVECPGHGWRFRISDGAWVSCPKNRNPSYPVRVDAGVVYLQISPKPAA